MQLLITSSASFYIPLSAVFNLFVLILQDSDPDSAQSNLVLIDVGAGYFARLEFSSESSICIPLIKEMSRLARAFVNQQRAVTERQRNADVLALDPSLVQEPVSVLPDVADDTILAETTMGDDVRTHPDPLQQRLTKLVYLVARLRWL